MTEKIFSVSEVNAYIKTLFMRDFVLSHITISGEVSNCKYHSSGHVYFTLKDGSSELSAVMFAGDRVGLLFKIEDGQLLEVTGQIAVYERTGRYQLYAKKCTLSGAGRLYEKYLKLKDELENMGMFDPMYKKPIPRFCMSIGVVTALTGAAIQDIINVSKRRNPYVRLLLYPARVQGEGAAKTITSGIRALDRLKLDVIIVGRGGGSIEDLWAFNEPEVAQAIFEADTPIISAVGHETDFTIADFVADLRAPTPSAAAEMANFVYDDLEEELYANVLSMQTALFSKIRLIRSEVNVRSARLYALNPINVLQTKKAHIKSVRDDMTKCALSQIEETLGRCHKLDVNISMIMKDLVRDSSLRLKFAVSSLEAASPLKKISGGYGYLVNEKGQSVSSIRNIKVGAALSVFISDGKIESAVRSVTPLNNFIKDEA